MMAPHLDFSWYLTTVTDKNASQISGLKLWQGLLINENKYTNILQYCTGEINKISNSRLLVSRAVRNGVKRAVFDLFNTKYRNVFKRPDLPSKFEAFALTIKKLI